MKLKKYYPGHANSFIKYGLAPKLFPSFKKFVGKNKLYN